MSLVGVCALVSCIIVALHLRERRQDHQVTTHSLIIQVNNLFCRPSFKRCTDFTLTRCSLLCDKSEISTLYLFGHWSVLRLDSCDPSSINIPDMSRKTDQEKMSPGDPSKNRGWPKGKRRYPKGAGAPKQPLSGRSLANGKIELYKFSDHEHDSGYVHFLNERRETVRAENPEITFSDLSKKLAAEWSALGEAEKNKYNEQAKRDKDRLALIILLIPIFLLPRYDKEFSDYQHTDSYKQYLEVESTREAKAPSASAASKKKKKPASSSQGSSSKRPSLELESDQEVAMQVSRPSPSCPHILT